MRALLGWWLAAGLVGLLLSATVCGHSLTDLAGREVAWDGPADRIIAIGPSSLRLVAYVAATSALVGVEAMEQEDPAGRTYTMAHGDLFRTLPVVGQGGAGRVVDREAILRLRPDVIVANALEPTEADRLSREVRAPVVLISFGEDGIYDEAAVLRSIELVGALSGRSDRAEELIARIRSMREDLGRRTRDLPHPAPVYVGAVSYKGIHGIASTQAHFLPLSLINTPGYVDQLSPRPRQLFIDREQILLWNPSHLFIDAGGLPRVQAEAARSPRFFERLRAFAEGRAFTTYPFNSYGTNLEIAFANAYFLGTVLYPDRFADIDPRRQLEQIVTDFLGPTDLAPLHEAYPGFRSIGFLDGALQVAPTGF